MVRQAGLSGHQNHCPKVALGRSVPPPWNTEPGSRIPWDGDRAPPRPRDQRDHVPRTPWDGDRPPDPLGTTGTTPPRPPDPLGRAAPDDTFGQ